MLLLTNPLIENINNVTVTRSSSSSATLELMTYYPPCFQVFHQGVTYFRFSEVNNITMSLPRSRTPRASPAPSHKSFAVSGERSLEIEIL